MDTPINIQVQDGNQVVNARELHQFLDIETKFTTWIERRVEDYGFIENEDFEVFLKNGKNSKGGRPSKEYAISLDMAKELSMIERNEKGRQARKYFIECEKQLKNTVLSSATNLPTLPIKPIAEKRKEHQKALMDIIRINLNKGDIKRLSEDNKIPYNRLRNVIALKTFDYDIIYLLYETARNNLMFLSTEISSLKEDLTNLSA